MITKRETYNTMSRIQVVTTYGKCSYCKNELNMVEYFVRTKFNSPTEYLCPICNTVHTEVYDESN